MWTELAALRCTAAFLHANYTAIDDDTPLTDLVYAPESKGRMKDVTKVAFLERLERYMQAVVTGRLVLLSAAFELYFRYFLDDYLKARPKYYDATAGGRTADGDKLYGEVTKVRGLSERITKFAELANAKVNRITPHLLALTDVYQLRNVIAHRAGAVDAGAASKLSIVKLTAGQRAIVTVEELLKLAASVLEIANALDGKITDPAPAPPKRRRPSARVPRKPR